MVGHGGSSAGSYLADPTSPIPSHCASIVATSTLRVKWFWCDILPLLKGLMWHCTFTERFWCDVTLSSGWMWHSIIIERFWCDILHLLRGFDVTYREVLCDIVPLLRGFDVTCYLYWEALMWFVTFIERLWCDLLPLLRGFDVTCYLYWEALMWLVTFTERIWCDLLPLLRGFDVTCYLYWDSLMWLVTFIERFLVLQKFPTCESHPEVCCDLLGSVQLLTGCQQYAISTLCKTTLTNTSGKCNTVHLYSNQDYENGNFSCTS